LLAHRQVRALLSDDHFSVDGTQVQAWASMKSFVAKDGSGEPPSAGRNGERHFHGEQRSNETHSSTTDPEATLAKKGKGRHAGVSSSGVLRQSRAASPSGEWRGEGCVALNSSTARSR